MTPEEQMEAFERVCGIKVEYDRETFNGQDPPLHRVWMYVKAPTTKVELRVSFYEECCGGYCKAEAVDRALAAFAWVSGEEYAIWRRSTQKVIEVPLKYGPGNCPVHCSEMGYCQAEVDTACEDCRTGVPPGCPLKDGGTVLVKAKEVEDAKP